MNPTYPIYIISKGRWESRLTSKALERNGVPYRIVIEPQEYKQYASVINPSKILTLPFSNLGQGSIPARNWVWEHSISEGHKRHWILDDNIGYFTRWKDNQRQYARDGMNFVFIERFVDRYVNVPMAGMQYQTFAIQGASGLKKPFLLNARVYSCILLSNDIPHRWRGRYNEDTDLSLRILKDGYCTMLFYAFLCGKAATMTMKGGNTEHLYQMTERFDGRLEMAKSLQQQHPDVTRIKQRWGRWQHQVDYGPFRKNSLIRKPVDEWPEMPSQQQHDSNLEPVAKSRRYSALSKRERKRNKMQAADQADGQADG